MKKLLLPILLISAIWTQCDSNNDGELNVVDVIILVDYIFNN